MKIFIKFFTVLVSVTSVPLVADSLIIPNVFSAGTPAVAAEVNGNFTAIKDAVDDNDGRITALENANLAGLLDKQLTGLVQMSNGSDVVFGNGTLFSTELNVGDAILIAGEAFIINAITSDTELQTVNARTDVGVVDINIFSDADLLALSNGAGVDKAVITKSGDFIRRSQRVTGLGLVISSSSGLILGRQLVFKKSRDSTAVKITYGDNFRAFSDTEDIAACRWEIIADGVTCPGGALIYDFYVHHAGAFLNTPRSGTLFGFCEGLSSGAHTLEVKVGPVPGVTPSSCLTGYQNSRWTIEAEEVF